VPSIRLRPLRAEDQRALADNHTEAADPWNFFGYSDGPPERGLISDDRGVLAVESEDGTLLGEVSWNAVLHGPSPSCRALNVGITLFTEHRGRGFGTAAQTALAAYLFRSTRVERLEAGTDVDNLAEQRALEKAGFTREGVLRHAQFRAGTWRDVVLYSRLRHD
jgi:RimJ/RimL family protein N-acetyltransferase